jgi:hypothetical protein
VILLRYITYLLFCPLASGTRKRSGAAPKARSCFSGGDRNRGSQNRNGAIGKAEAAQAPGAARAPKQCRDLESRPGNVYEQIAIPLLASGGENRVQDTHRSESIAAWERSVAHQRNGSVVVLETDFSVIKEEAGGEGEQRQKAEPPWAGSALAKRSHR